MTIKILSDSETGRMSYKKEVDEFLENGLASADIPQGRPLSGQGENSTQTASAPGAIGASAVEGSTLSSNYGSVDTATGSVRTAYENANSNAAISATNTTSMNGQEDSLG